MGFHHPNDDHVEREQASFFRHDIYESLAAVANSTLTAAGRDIKIGGRFRGLESFMAPEIPRKCEAVYQARTWRAVSHDGGRTISASLVQWQSNGFVILKRVFAFFGDA
jgi:hypothetical protein